METAFVSLICIALMVVGGMTMSRGFLASIDNTSNNIQAVSQRDEEIMRTNIQVLSAEQSASNQLEVAIRNIGQTKLTNMEKWDVIVHSNDASVQSHVTWLPYVDSSPGDNEWTLEGIYIDSDPMNQVPEYFEPGILNPEEEMVLECRLDPPVGEGTMNLVSISTPNGITVSKSFSGYSPP
jgi:hypothetical protein